MKYLLTTKPTVNVIRRMGLDIAKINEPELLKDILSVKDKLSHEWTTTHACTLMSKPNFPLFNTLSKLENITHGLDKPGVNATVGTAIVEETFKTLKSTNYAKSKTQLVSSIEIPAISEVMLLGGNTFVFVFETICEDDSEFYSLCTETNFKNAMPFDVRQEFLTHYGNLYGVNNMLALPLMSAHLLS